MANPNNHGGRRPNQTGRPKGVKAEKRKVALRPKQRAKITDKLVARAVQIDCSPLEVLMDTMKVFYTESKGLMKLSELETAAAKREKLRNKAKTEALAACKVATDLAPYIHAKLQSVTLKGDRNSPLEIALGLMDAPSLRAAVRGVVEAQQPPEPGK